MKKEVWKYVIISCLAFLGTVWCLFAYINTYIPEDSILVNTEKKVAYLTFDDGPSKNTEEILNILDTYKVKATFFVTGLNKEYYDMIKKEKDAGHIIGIHTFSHDYESIYSSEEAYFDDIDMIQDIIVKQTGQLSMILRFPGGSSNTVSKNYSAGIMKVLTDAVTEKGYLYFDWNASNGDGNSNMSTASLINTALKEIRGKNEVMILMHDGTGNKNTVEALPIILKSMISQGYEFQVIDTSSAVFHHQIAN